MNDADEALIESLETTIKKIVTMLTHPIMQDFHCLLELVLELEALGLLKIGHEVFDLASLLNHLLEASALEDFDKAS